MEESEYAGFLAAVDAVEQVVEYAALKKRRGGQADRREVIRALNDARKYGIVIRQRDVEGFLP